MQYKARYGKVWKSRKGGKVYSNLVELKKSESITDYIQIDEPKQVPKPPIKETTKSISDEKESVK